MHDEQQLCLLNVEKTLSSSEALRKNNEENFFPKFLLANSRKSEGGGKNSFKVIYLKKEGR